MTMRQRDEEKTCCICGASFTGQGYNPYPVTDGGECCRRCNCEVVVPERIRRHEEWQRPRVTDKKAYISGAIAHHDLCERKAAFAQAEKALERAGLIPVNPFRNGLPDDAAWTEHLKADIGLLLGCDYIYMLRGWELSKGAKLELDVASSCGIQVLFENQFNP